jgi:hypothetical protein
VTLTGSWQSTCFEVFVACWEAKQRAVLIRRVSRSDKEFHFQNWFGDRLDDAGLRHDSIGRNTYPDFTLVHQAEGYEIKGLQWPGRVASYDSNSRVPTGEHNGRRIFYVFGRYPASTDDPEYPVVDLVLCHGDFLNVDHTYVHENKSFRGFGSYGDLLVRDRKMYVAPTPFALTDGTTGQATLIIPDDLPLDDRFEQVGELVRTEADTMVVSYSFDLRTNELTPQLLPNPSAGLQHRFLACRPQGTNTATVTMKEMDHVARQLDGSQ